MASSGLHKDHIMCAQKMKKKKTISFLRRPTKIKRKIDVLIIQSAHFIALFSICTIVL